MPTPRIARQTLPPYSRYCISRHRMPWRGADAMDANTDLNRSSTVAAADSCYGGCSQDYFVWKGPLHRKQVGAVTRQVRASRHLWNPNSLPVQLQYHRID